MGKSLQVLNLLALLSVVGGQLLEAKISLAQDESVGKTLTMGRPVNSSEPLPENEILWFRKVVGEFTTGTIEHTLLAGIDLFRRENPLTTTLVFFPSQILNVFNPVYGPRPDPSNFPTFTDAVNRTDTLGLYIQDQVNLLDNLKLLLGVRYDFMDIVLEIITTVLC